MTTRGSTFVSVPADALMSELDEIATAVSSPDVADGMVPGDYSGCLMGRERVVTIRLSGHPDSRPAIRIFTSLAAGSDVVRDVGEDAVRIVVGVARRPDAANTVFTFIPAGGVRRIFRTAPRNLPEPERVAAFLARLRQALREAYQQARAIPVCRECGRLMRERDGRHGRFLGCSGYPDDCKFTRAIPGENVGA